MRYFCGFKPLQVLLSMKPLYTYSYYSFHVIHIQRMVVLRKILSGKLAKKLYIDVMVNQTILGPKHALCTEQKKSK